jgi:mono/diheme cytochrome c family protein
MLGQMKLSRPLTGYTLGRFAAPDITPTGLVSRGWTAEGLHAFLSTGLAAQGSAYSDMHPVILLSTQHLTAADLDAVVTYLLGDTPPHPVVLAVAALDPMTTGPGRATYVALCAGCHGLDGNGEPNTVVAMRDNATLRLTDPRNLVMSILHGIAAQDFPGQESMQTMPGFADKLSDAQAAGLANYLRGTWGGQQPDVTPLAVRAMR